MNLRNLWHRARHKVALATTSLAMPPSLALAQQGLPDLEQPDNPGDGGLIDTLQGYGLQIASLVGLVLCAVAFYFVAGALMASFREAREREQWGKFILTAAVGVGLIVVVIWLANMAAPILEQ